MLLALAGCGMSVPTDPDGTLERVRDEATVRAGASPRPGWVEVDSGRPTGPEVRLVEAFAGSLGAEVSWTVAGEEHLVRLLEEGDLDLAVGGMTDKNPWMDKVAVTRPYAEVQAGGKTEKHVMWAPMGENAFLSELEQWLDVHAGEAVG
jgi:ABC-type amino acid transport substrate-binding protein